MAFGMRIAGESKQEIDRRVRQAADILQLTKYLERLPKALSGGQRQRVAIGRAIVRNPKVFLFDEPLSNLDAALRVATRIEIAKLHEEMSNTTMIYVTHDQVEAMTLADRIVVLNAGKIEQVGAPMELYHHPANLFVARFIGSPAMNTFACTVEAGNGAARVKAEGGSSVRVPAKIPSGSVGRPGLLGIRPEDLTLADGGAAIFKGTVVLVEKLGEVTMLYMNVPGSKEPIIAKLGGDAVVERGAEVGITATTENLHVFDENGIAFPRTKH
jgi:ABC-type sugar transport system ATPase subunit